MTTTNSNPIIETKPIVFSHLFHTGKFEVPWHQRRYDWRKDHVSDLLFDLDEAFKEKRKCYFLGAIMLVQKSAKIWEINDGQQRMITFSLICARLSRSFHVANVSLHEGHALRVLFDLDVNSTKQLSDANELEPRLLPPRDDKNHYFQMIRNENIGSNGKLTDAWQLIDRFVSGMELELSKQFMEFVLNRIEVACLYIPDDVDPNSVFETINCRGKPLENWDLIRNYLYSYFNASDENSRRETLHNNLENVPTQLRSDTKAAEYARCYFQCKYGFLPKTSFYRETKNAIRSIVYTKNSADYIYDLVSEFSLKERVALFETIANPGSTNDSIDNFQRQSNSNRKKRNLSVFLQELNAYKVAQPMVFALLSRYVMELDATKKKRLAKRVHADLNRITSFILRTSFVAPKFEPSPFECEFSNLAKEIMSAKDLYCIDIMNFLKNLDGTYGIIDDKKFIDKIKVVEIRDAGRIKRFLLGVNRSMQSDSSLINETRCSVEHILPKSVEHWPSWNNFEENNPEDWVHRIGNLTLLGQDDNKPGKNENANFSRKKEILGRSAIKLTRELNYDDWSPDIIAARQEKLAKLAAKNVWIF